MLFAYRNYLGMFFTVKVISSERKRIEGTKYSMKERG